MVREYAEALDRDDRVATADLVRRLTAEGRYDGLAAQGTYGHKYDVRAVFEDLRDHAFRDQLLHSAQGGVDQHVQCR